MGKETLGYVLKVPRAFHILCGSQLFTFLSSSARV